MQAPDALCVTPKFYPEVPVRKAKNVVPRSDTCIGTFQSRTPPSHIRLLQHPSFDYRPDRRLPLAPLRRCAPPPTLREYRFQRVRRGSVHLTQILSIPRDMGVRLGSGTAKLTNSGGISSNCVNIHQGFENWGQRRSGPPDSHSCSIGKGR